MAGLRPPCRREAGTLADGSVRRACRADRCGEGLAVQSLDGAVRGYSVRMFEPRLPIIASAQVSKARNSAGMGAVYHRYAESGAGEADV